MDRTGAKPNEGGAVAKRHLAVKDYTVTVTTVAPGAGRAAKTHCSVACRQQAYRDRQLRAVALRAEGLPEKEIARQLNSDVKTVRGWLKATDGEATEPKPLRPGPQL